MIEAHDKKFASCLRQPRLSYTENKSGRILVQTKREGVISESSEGISWENLKKYSYIAIGSVQLNLLSRVFLILRKLVFRDFSLMKIDQLIHFLFGKISTSLNRDNKKWLKN